MQASTFHAMCARVLRAHAEVIGRSPQFTVYDEDNQKRTIARLLSEAEECVHRPQRRCCTRYRPARTRPCKSTGTRASPSTNAARSSLESGREYEQELRRGDALDFDDLLLRTVLLLQARPDLLAAYRKRWRAVLVDEYQDTNPIQARLLRLLVRCAENRHFMAVGDDRQVIYGFRLADVRLILGFTEEYPGASVVKLVRNYRNPQLILDAANSVIAHNKRQFPLELFADEKNQAGKPITVARVAEGHRRGALDRLGNPARARAWRDARETSRYSAGART